MLRKPLNTKQIQMSLVQRISRTKNSIEMLSIDKNPQVQEMVIRLKGELSALEMVHAAIMDRTTYFIDNL